MIQKGRTSGDQFETSPVADRQMSWWVTDHAKNPADPVQLIEGFAGLQIDEQVRTKPQGIFRRFAFLRDLRYRLAANQRYGRDIVRAAVVVQQEEPFT